MNANDCTKCAGKGHDTDVLNPLAEIECWYCFGTGDVNAERWVRDPARLDELDHFEFRRAAKMPYYSGATYPAFTGKAKTSEDSPLQLDELDLGAVPGKLYIGFAPGKFQAGRHDRSMDLDLDVLRHAEIKHVLCLVEDFELQMLQMADYAEKCADRGILLHRLPIKDGSVGKLDAVFTAALAMVWLIEQGESVYVHCKGGLGRAGTLAACILLLAQESPVTPEYAIEAVRAARSPRAIENKLQERFVTDFYHAYSAAS